MGQRVVDWRSESSVAHADQDRSFALRIIGWSEDRDRQIKNAVAIEICDRDADWVVMQRDFRSGAKGAIAISKRDISRENSVRNNEICFAVAVKVSAGNFD